MRATHIAEREFERADGRGLVRVALLHPRPSGKNGNYRCRISITGLGPETEWLHAYGVDSLQALCLAIQVLHSRLELRKRELRWHGHPMFGVPAFIPQLGPRIEARLKRAVNRELEAINSELEKAHRQRPPRAGARARAPAGKQARPTRTR